MVAFVVVQALVEVVRPAAGPDTQLSRLVLGEAVGGELVVRPVRPGQAVAEVLEAELVTPVPLAEALELAGGAVAGGGVDVDEVADRAAVCQRADLRTDDGVEGEDRAVLGEGGRAGSRSAP